MPRQSPQMTWSQGDSIDPRLLLRLPQGSGETVLPREGAAAGALPEARPALFGGAPREQKAPRRVPDPHMHAKMAVPRREGGAPALDAPGFPARRVVDVPQLVRRILPHLRVKLVMIVFRHQITSLRRQGNTRRQALQESDSTEAENYPFHR